MGVQNLWMLLAPVGRQIEIETLASNVLAVDASIWLTQFIKAMRDDEGNMIKNAHLIGTFHRVAKLLFYRIRPVFVFDGNTPEIKKRTVARRRKRQEHQAANLKQTAQRILLNRLKLYREELKKNGGKRAVNSAVAENFLLPTPTPKKAAADEETKEDKADDVIAIDDSEEEEVDGHASVGESAALGSAVVDVVSLEDEEKKSDGVDEDDEMTADDIILDTSRLSRIDLDAVFALPPHLQKDMIERIRRDRRQEARDRFIPLAGNPEAYSRTQISSFLQTSKLNRQILRATKKSAQREMEKAAAEVSVEGRDNLLIGHGKRIASSSDRFFIYENAKNQVSSEDGDDSDDDPAVTDPGFVKNEAAGWKLSGSQERVTEAENDEDIFDRIHGSKRKHRYLEESNVAVKRSLTDFSIGSVKDFAVALDRSQRRKIAVEEARLKFLAKSESKASDTGGGDQKGHHREPDEPKEKTIDSDGNSKPVVKDITITFGADDITTLDEKAKELFPLSLFEAVANDQPRVSANEAEIPLDESGGVDDVEWEDVPQPPERTMTEGLTSVTSPFPGTKVEKRSDDEMEDTEWETVSSTADIGARDIIHAADQSVPDDQGGHKVSEKVANIGKAATVNEGAPDVGDEEEVETTDLYASLRQELEEEQAEDDLSLLKEEALQSAIATASNLTQWAAGAVRRALAQHTRHTDSLHLPSKLSSSDRALQKHASPDMKQETEVIDLSQEDATESVNIDSVVLPSKTSSPATENNITKADDDDELLRRAIQQSLEASQSQKSANASTSRYLHYAPSTDGEPALDVEAISEEQRELKKLRNRQLRDTEGVNDEMVEDVMELLQLFGVPYLVCPMEAEAQCAALEQLGLVDGIITDDSDIFPFGGRRVYKNIFHNQKFVEAFLANDVEKELGFSQEEMISLALLLGSDYTDGVRGIGIVNASEVVAAYPGLEGLKEFKKWVQTFDVAEEARRRLERKKTQAEIDAMTPRERFEYTHANVRRKWELGDEFPNPHVIQAYKNPQVDRSDARFSWELPNLAGLREYCTKTFGWDQTKTDTVLLPLMEQIASFANERHRQTRIDQFFTKYDDNVKYAKIQSKRLRSAVEGKTGKSNSRSQTAQGSKSPLRNRAPQGRSQPPVRVQKGRFTKTKKTTSTLGL